MHFNMKELCEVLNQYEEIVIYGAGHYARQIYPELVKYGFKDKIICFTQTQKNDTVSIEGIPVIQIDEINCNRRNCCILIAVNAVYVDELMNVSLNYGFINMVSLIDYLDNEIQYYEQFEERFMRLETFEEYCEFIAKWYVKVHKNGINSQEIVQQLLHRGRNAHRVDSNLIVIICGYLTPRTVKIISALKKRHFNIVLLNYGLQERTWLWDELKKIKIQIYKCHRIEELLYMALQYSPLVYFFEPRWGDCCSAQIMIKNKKYFGKVVLSLYDVLSYGYVGKEKISLSEKYALEHADGIVWRWFAKEYLEKKGFQYEGKSIQFVDFCSREEIAPKHSDSPEIKLCLVAGNGNIYVSDREYSSEYLDYARIGEILNKIGNEQKCIFHFYAGTLSDENIERCKQYETQYKNFKYFLATEHNELVQRLAVYDYGCELWGSEDAPEAPDDVPVGVYYGSAYHNCIRNAYFDYLSAGLPIITTQSTKLWESLYSYDVVVQMKLYNFDVGYLMQNRKRYRENVEYARRMLDIDKNIIKLIQFFQEV